MRTGFTSHVLEPDVPILLGAGAGDPEPDEPDGDEEPDDEEPDE